MFAASFDHEAEAAEHGDSVEVAIDSSLYMQDHVSPIVVAATPDNGPCSSQLEIERVQNGSQRRHRQNPVRPTHCPRCHSAGTPIHCGRMQSHATVSAWSRTRQKPPVRALIALTARSVGAVVITCNGADFEALREEQSFKLAVWTAD